jgi:hypothetical protein
VGCCTQCRLSNSLPTNSATLAHYFALQLTYNHVSHPSSFFTSVLLGSATTSSPNVVVKSLRLGLQEAIIKAEVYAPK